MTERPIHANRLRMESRHDAIYREMRLAAIEVRICPSNLYLCRASGYSAHTGVCDALHVMTTQGEITVRQIDGVRVVEFADGLRTAGYPEFAKLRDEVARAFGIEPFKVIAGGRRTHIVRVRFAVICALRTRFPEIGLKAIGRVLGGRDHTTILNGFERGQYFYARDADFRDRVDAVVEGRRPVVAAVERGPHTIAVRRDRKRPIAPEVIAKPTPTSWCNQCESRKTAEQATKCGSRWCSLKAVA